MIFLFVFACVALVSFLVSLLGTRWAIDLADRHEAFELPAVGKIHQKKVPNLGWLGIGGGWIVSLTVLAVIVLLCRFVGKAQDPYVAGMIRKMPVMAGILTGGILSVLLGWLDDLRKLSPVWKLASQIAVACLLCLLGVRITLFGPPLLGVPLTIIWVVCVMNAFNLLDNLDGACAGVAMIACLLFLCVAVLLGQYFISLLLAAFFGTLGGFLVFNFPPARIFMGNAGSSFVGYVLSAVTILETFYKKGVPSHLAVIMPILILAVPIYDTASVILIRLYRRVPIYRGDTNHFSHRLLRRGLSSRQAVCVIYAITVGIGLGALFLPFVSAAWSLLILAACVCFLFLLGFLELSRK